MKQLLITSLLFFLATASLLAQTPDTESIEERLKEQGVDEEVRKKLEEQGIDINNIKPSELPALEKALEEAVREKEAAEEEKEEEKPKEEEEEPEEPEEPIEEEEDPEKSEERVIKEAEEVARKTAREIQDAVQEGTPIDQAIAEEIIDEAREDLPESNVYGQQIFRDKSIEVFTQSEDARPPDSYILGPGDRVNISIWGLSEEDATYEINKTGFIKPAQMPRINLKGITYGKARSLLRSRFSQYYRFRPEEFEVTISYARTITVNIYGEVFQPGGYTMPATNTVFNALVAAGGPSNIGSVRNIRLIRTNTVEEVDVYAFMNSPSLDNQFFLNENDIIHVDVAQKVVLISGAVRRPFRYELKEDENLLDLIKYAGGLMPNAYQKNIVIQRIVDEKPRLVDVNLRELKAQGKDFPLRKGDRITIRTVSEPLKEFVRIDGATILFGNFELEPDMRITDLVAKAELNFDVRTDVAYLIRYNDDETYRYERVPLAEILANPDSPRNLPLRPKDYLKILSKGVFIDKANFTIQGAVRKPKEFPFDMSEGMRVSDAVLLAGGVKSGAMDIAYIYRTDPESPKTREYLRFNIQEAIAEPNSPENLTIKPNDKIIVYSKANFLDDATVSTTGSVRAPGNFAYDDELRLSDVLYFSKGLAINASDIGYVVRRDPTDQSIKNYIRVDLGAIRNNPQDSANIKLEPFDQLRVYPKSLFTDKFTVSVKGAVRRPGQYEYNQSLQLRDVLTFAGGLRFEAANGRVEVSRVMIRENKSTEIVVATIGVDENLNIVSGNANNFSLQPFDEVMVRFAPEFELQQNVTIEGEVKYPGPYPLISDNERLLSIVQRSGGLTNEAFPEGATLYRRAESKGFIIIDLNKVMRNNKHQSNFILKSGDVITVPKKEDLVTLMLDNTKVEKLYPEKITEGGQINVAHKNKSAGYYLKKYMGGAEKPGKKRYVAVEHPNGEIKSTKRLLFFNLYPKVKKGSTVSVGSKPEKIPLEGEQPKEPSDWNRIVSSTISQVTAILTLILLVRRVGD